MNTLKTVLNKLQDSRRTQLSRKTKSSKKLDLSSISELERWRDFYTVDSNNFQDLRNLQSTMLDAESSFMAFRNDYDMFITAYNYVRDNYDINEVIKNVADGQMLLEQFEIKANELGLDASSNQVYNDVVEAREDLIRFMEDLRYVGTLAEQLEQNVNTFN